jgi:SAM-dependent methyltransferase
MTVWDNIYKDYKEGGEAWATLSEGIIPDFISLVETSDFTIKKAFDIGVGTGKYLKYLQSRGFTVAGLDSSPTAVDYARDVLDTHDEITCADMFAFPLGDEKFDLILSVSTLHHGKKDQIRELVENIHKALIKSGKIFITVPDYQSAINRNEFHDQEKVEECTYAPLSGPEVGLPHSFYSKAEVELLFQKFNNLQIHLDELERWVITGEK